MLRFIRQPTAIPVFLLLAGAYALGTSPVSPGLAAMLWDPPAPAPCGCTGDAGCCGAGCCSAPEEAVPSCCEAAPSPAAGPAWDAACTCGGRGPHGVTAPGCDRHVPAAATARIPTPAAIPVPAGSPVRCTAPDLDTDDPVPRPPSGSPTC